MALMLGRARVWDEQQREPYRLSWSAAIARLWPATLFGFALLAFLIVAAPHAVPWFLPFIVGLILAIPFAVATASGTLGVWAAARKLCAAPEEISMPEDVAAVLGQTRAQRVGRSEKAGHFVRARITTAFVVLTLLELALLPATAASTIMPDTDMTGFDYRHFELPKPRPRLCQEACFND